MAYELYIFPQEGAPPTTTTQTVVEAFARAELPCTEQPDQFGHWLLLEGFESALDLTVKDGIVTGAGFHYATEDDMSIAHRVADVFKSTAILILELLGVWCPRFSVLGGGRHPKGWTPNAANPSK